jgi:hypothetical protein
MYDNQAGGRGRRRDRDGMTAMAGSFLGRPAPDLVGVSDDPKVTVRYAGGGDVLGIAVLVGGPCVASGMVDPDDRLSPV